VTIVNAKILTMAIITTVLCIGCANKMAPFGGSPQDPIFPRTSSILPLEKNNNWVYSYTAYDTLGKKIIPNRKDLHFSINVQYGLQNDSTLVLLNSSNYQTKFPVYAYQYEMENRAMGYIVVYRGLYPLPVRGLYIIGEYKDTVVRQYASEQFWLAYPADSGKIWSFKTDPLGDTTIEDTMEVLSTNARFYVPDNASMTSTSVYDSCYLYKQKRGNNVSYYYYNATVGCLGYQHYVDGTLRETYILKSFSQDHI
jgi:hypothetical protein